MSNELPYLSILHFLGLLAVFLLPGYGLSSWLHRADHFAAPTRWVLAFSWSMALFGVCAGPYLWLQGDLQDFLNLLYPVWGIYAILGAVAYWWACRHPLSLPAAAPSAPEPQPADVSGKALWSMAALLAVNAAAVAGVAFAWVEEGELFEALAVGGLGPVFVLGVVTAWRLRVSWGTLLRFTAKDREAAPPLWWALALGLILFQAVSAVVYDRPDWDDCFYLSAALDYQHGGTLNGREPVVREGGEMPPIYRALCWELWGGVICRLTGLHPMVLFHTLLPGILVLLSYAAYTALLGEFLPRRWVPLALAGLSAFHLWGISAHMSAANHLLPRLWQGKAVLLHVAVPLLVVLLNRYMAAPSVGRWLSLVVCVLFGLSVSFSVIFMGLALLSCLSLAMMFAHRTRVWALAGVALAALPLLACGLLLLAAMHAAPGEVIFALTPSTDWASWSGEIAARTWHGSAELVWLLSLPLLVVLVGERRGLAYLVVFPFLLTLTFVNPLLFHPVATYLTSYFTYHRLLWLLPVGPGLAILLALSVRLVLRLRALAPRQEVAAGLGLTLAGLALTFLLPGIYVWSERNNFIGPLGTPHLAQNPEKMPGDLLPIARRLAGEPGIDKVRILCNFSVASFLAPYSRDFLFLQTRPAPYGGARPNRPLHGLECYLLSVVLSEDGFPPLEDEESWWVSQAFHPFEWKALRSVYGEEVVARICQRVTDQPTQYVRQLLREHQVKYVVTGPGDKAAAIFERCDYRPVLRQGAFTLWQAP
jgi:hypothetical protein